MTSSNPVSFILILRELYLSMACLRFFFKGGSADLTWWPELGPKILQSVRNDNVALRFSILHDVTSLKTVLQRYRTCLLQSIASYCNCCSPRYIRDGISKVDSSTENHDENEQLNTWFKKLHSEQKERSIIARFWTLDSHHWTRTRKLQGRCGRSKFWSIMLRMVPMGIKWTKQWKKRMQHQKSELRLFKWPNGMDRITRLRHQLQALNTQPGLMSMSRDNIFWLSLLATTIMPI